MNLSICPSKKEAQVGPFMVLDLHCDMYIAHSGKHRTTIVLDEAKQDELVIYWRK